MKIFGRWCYSLAVLPLCLLFVLSRGDTAEATVSGAGIVCTTTALGSVLGAVGGTNLDVHVFMPFGMCPGHFDLTPGDAARLRDADLLFFHGFELFLKGLDKGQGAGQVRVEVQGNWMVPEIYKKAVVEIEKILSGNFPGQRGVFVDNRDRYLEAIDEAVLKFEKRIAGFAGTKVICSGMNRDFVERMGLEVVATFPRDEHISLRAMERAVKAGRDSGAMLVIDNMQSSGKTGRTIADALGVPLVVLSNFPRPGSGSEYDYIETLLESCGEILKILEPAIIKGNNL